MCLQPCDNFRLIRTMLTQRICACFSHKPCSVIPKWTHSRAFSTTKRTHESSSRFNAVNIQMLSSSLHSQLFPGATQTPTDEAVEKSIKHLKEHDLWGRKTDVMKDVNMDLPKLLGGNIDEHFRIIAKQISQPYFDMSNEIAYATLPEQPSEWLYVPGWSKYQVTEEGIEVSSVDFPEEDAYVFDVEVCQNESPFPTLAVAASPNAWYGWVSPKLVEEKKYQWLIKPTPSLMIPLETSQQQDIGSAKWTEKLVIGHSVGFDRSYVKEQYFIKGPKTYFQDTLSLHMSVSGFSSGQRMQWNSYNAGKKAHRPWMEVGSGNKLADLYKLYCGQTDLDKSGQNVFINGTLDDIRAQFQELMSYCASDVAATHDIFTVLWPMYKDRFPHPVSYAGMLEMGSAYLPVDESWENYMRDSNDIANDLDNEMKKMVMKIADEACRYQHGERYKSDPWLWGLDWSVQCPTKKYMTNSQSKQNNDTKPADSVDEEENLLDERALVRFEKSQDQILDLEKVKQDAQSINETIAMIPSADDVMFKKRKHMPGYPLWYRSICSRETRSPRLNTGFQITPMLLRMTWDGYPLHYTRKHGWGYLVPGRMDNLTVEDKEDDDGKKDSDERDLFPTKSFQALLAGLQNKSKTEREPVSDEDTDVRLITQSDLWANVEIDKNLSSSKKGKPAELSENHLPNHHGFGPFNDVDLPGVWFFRIPHKNGDQYKCGNPLAKDYITKLDDGTLATAGDHNARRILVLARNISFWLRQKKTLNNEMPVLLNPDDLPPDIKRSPEYKSDNLYGAIIPRLVPAGTITRRAVDSSWMTASNPSEDRVGSEQKSMIKAPPGYSFVGADVDSQELWIAAVQADAYFAGIHGSTAFGWMTLQGKKSDGTDLHSTTARTIKISRNHAKIFNYGRIYGAGQRFAENLLQQFNHRLTQDEAKSKAEILYKKTKGTKKYMPTEVGFEVLSSLNRLDKLDSNGFIDLTVSLELFKQAKSKNYRYRYLWKDMFQPVGWVGGSESEMFNKLESIAKSEQPRTPALGCRISRTLEPHVAKDEYMTSRVNWVVQSSAVDYLHLMLVCMKWLFTEYQIDGRFCISIHDEVRYLVVNKDKYRAALALQITNLLTRAMFAYKLNIMDLPQSVAFFSSVDIDKVLRKEVTMDCKTPSNPQGLQEGHGIPPGEALDIYQILEKTNNGCLSALQPEESSQITFNDGLPV